MSIKMPFWIGWITWKISLTTQHCNNDLDIPSDNTTKKTHKATKSSLKLLKNTTNSDKAETVDCSKATVAQIQAIERTAKLNMRLLNICLSKLNGSDLQLTNMECYYELCEMWKAQLTGLSGTVELADWHTCGFIFTSGPPPRTILKKSTMPLV